MKKKQEPFFQRIVLFYNRHQALLLLVLALLVNLLGFLYVTGTKDCYFAQNDDYRMRDLASGAYLGYPTPYLVFMKYPVGLLLSQAYSYLPSIPWYGLFLYACVFFPCVIALYRISRQCKSIKQVGVIYLLYLLFFYCLIQRHILAPQFTTSAAFLAAGAAVLLLTAFCNRGKGWFVADLLLCGLLCFFSVCVREKTFLMFVPILLVILLVQLFAHKKLWRRVLALLLTMAFCYSGVMILESAVETEEYKEYKAFNTARSRVYDYYEIPEWEENEAFYESIGLDRTLAQSIRSRYYDLDPAVTTDALNALADYIKELEQETPFLDRLLTAVADTAENFFDSNILLPQTIFILLLAGVLFLTAAVKRRPVPLIILCAAIGSVCMEMVGFILNGRMVSRLPESMLIVLTFLLLSLLTMLLCDMQGLIKTAVQNNRGQEETENHPKLIHIFTALGVSGGTLILLFSLLMCSWRALDASVASFRGRAETLEKTVSFCREHPENFYYLDADDFITMTEPVLKEGETDYKNVESEGSWLVRSPMYQQKIGAYGFSSMTEGLVEHDNVYYLSTTRPDILIKYIKEEYESLRLIKIGTILEGKVWIYKVYTV